MAGDVTMASRREVRRVILVADLAGFTRAIGPLDTTTLGELVHRLYRRRGAG